MQSTGAGPPGQLGRVLSGWQEALSSGQGANAPARVDPRQMARTLGSVYIAGATLVLVWCLLLPTPPPSDRVAIVICALLGELVGITLVSGLLDRQRRSAFEVAVAIATVLISVADYYARVRGAGLPFLYMWCTPYAFWFFPRSRALLQAGLVVVGFAAAEIAASLNSPTLAGSLRSDWGPILMLAGTVMIVGELVRQLGLRITESHQRFARIFADAPTPMARLGLNGRYLDANRAFCRAVGRERSAIVGASAFDLAPEDQLPLLQATSEKLLSGRSTGEQFERDYVRPDGTRVTLFTNISILGTLGRPGVELFVQALDLSERRLAEQALADSEQRYRTLVETSQAIVLAADLDGVCTFVNDRVRDVTGYGPEDLLGRSLLGFASESQHASTREQLRSAGRVTGEQVLVRKDGEEIIVNYDIAAVRDEHGTIVGVAGTVLDVTERRRAEQALAGSEERYRTLVEAAQALVWASDLQGRMTFANDAARTVLGYEPAELVGESVTITIPAEDRAAMTDLFARIRSGETVSGEAVHLRKDGEPIIGSYSVASVRDQHGVVAGFVGTVFDVTERRRAEEALRVSEARLRAVIDYAPAAITIRDSDGVLRTVNREAARLMGAGPEELIGKGYGDLYRRDEAAEMHLHDQRVIERDQPAFFEQSVHLADGEHIFLAVAFPLPAGREEKALVCRISFDVTDREHARQELMRSNEERRRLLAELVRAQEDERRRIAADVHDESIQVLAGVAIRLGMLTSMLDRPEQQRLIAGLDESVRRGIKSLRQLLFDLRLPALDELGLAAALRSYLSETIAREGATYTLEDHLGGEPPGELRTVLYRVAQEALSNVRKHAQARHVEVILRGGPTGFAVLVRDDGVGFEIKPHPSEVPGHLGMVGMRERIQAAGGWIEVHSEPGRGTQVEFGVPADTEALTALAVSRGS